MVAFLLGDLADSIHKCKGLFEVWESEFAVEMMFVNHFPLWSLLVECLKPAPLQGRNFPTARDALLVG